MQHPRIAGAAKLVAAALVLSACADADDGVAPDLPTDPQGANVPAHAQGSPPDRAALARAVPGFGGVFLEDGVPTVYLTDTSERPGAERALSAWLAQEGYAPGQLRVRQGRFAYDDLQAWFDAATRDVFAEGGVVFTDLHEGGNSVLIGVEDPGAAARVRAAALRAGVPAEALTVEVREPIRMLRTLQEEAPEIVGGIQINFPGWLCTLGFPAVQNNVMHFVTNSHCTENQGGVDDTPYYQPLQSVNNDRVGTEIKDPTYSSSLSGCPGGRVCRYSDASLARAEGSRPFKLGAIANAAVKSLTVDGELTITAKRTGSVGNCIVEGTEVHKIGRTTGHTFGTATNVCIAVGVSGTDIAQLQQVIVDGRGRIIDGGDSGSPAFTFGGAGVVLEGIVWGGSSRTLVFSPLPNVEQELGGLAVVGGGSPPPPPPPPGGVTASFTYDCGNLAACSFDASASTGAAPLSYSWNFGDGTTGSGVNPSHTYDGSGSFVVTLTVTETGGGQDGASSTIACNQRGPNLRCR
jgi:hypothetical protein